MGSAPSVSQEFQEATQTVALSGSQSMPLFRAVGVVVDTMLTMSPLRSKRRHDSDPLPRPSKYRRGDEWTRHEHSARAESVSANQAGDPQLQQCMERVSLELNVLGKFTHRKRYKLNELSQMLKGVADDFGIFCYLHPLPTLRRRMDAGAFNAVYSSSVQELPWNDKCAKRSFTESAGDTVLIRRATKHELLLKVTAELALTSLMSVNDVSPKVYGARIERTSGNPNRAYLTIIMEKFEMNLFDYYDKHTAEATANVLTLEHDLVRYLRFMANHGILCVDVKPENAVVNRSSRMPRLRLIDFSSDFCGYNFVTHSLHQEESLVNSLEHQIHQLVNQFHDTAQTAKFDAESNKNMRFGFMVIIFRCFCVIYRWELLGTTFSSMYNQEAGTFNSVPISYYQTWINKDVLRTRSALFHFLDSNEVGSGGLAHFTLSTTNNPFTGERTVILSMLLDNLYQTFVPRDPVQTRPPSGKKLIARRY